MKFLSVALISIFLTSIPSCDGKRIGGNNAPQKSPTSSVMPRFLQAYFKTQITTENFNIKIETPDYAFGREVSAPWRFPNPWEIMGNPNDFLGYTLGNFTALTLCFSPNTIVDVQNEDGEFAIKTQMQDLEVGDRVLTASGNYQTIYSFSHRNPTKRTEFVQLYTAADSNTPLELTKGHMVYVEGKSNPIPASSVSVGNKLKNVRRESSTVTKIDTVTRNGLYAPLTNDGTLVVNNGIVASAYSTLPGVFSDKEHLEIAGVKVFSQQSFYDTLLIPYRYFCTGISMDLCKTTSERDMYTWIGTALYGNWMQQSELVKSLSLSVFLLFVYSVRFITSNPYGVIIAVAALVCGASCKAKSKKQKLC